MRKGSITQTLLQYRTIAGIKHGNVRLWSLYLDRNQRQGADVGQFRLIVSGIMLPVGRLVHVLELQRATTAPDEAGAPVQTWAHLATLRAEMLVDDGLEAISPGGG